MQITPSFWRCMYLIGIDFMYFASSLIHIWDCGHEGYLEKSYVMVKKSDPWYNVVGSFLAWIHMLSTIVIKLIITACQNMLTSKNIYCCGDHIITIYHQYVPIYSHDDNSISIHFVTRLDANKYLQGFGWVGIICCTCYLMSTCT